MLFIVIKKVNATITDTEITTLFDSLGKSLVTFEKPLINPHYHILLETTLKINNVRNKISRTFDIKGGQRTVAELRTTVDRTAIYILKEYHLINNTLFTDEKLTELQSESHRVNLDKEKKVKKNTFAVVFVDSYTPLEHYLSEEEVKRHMCLHIQKEFKRDYQKLDEYIFRRHYFMLKNHYYEELIKYDIEKWSQQL